MRLQPSTRLLVGALAAALTVAAPAGAQQPAGGNPLSQELAAFRQAMAANQQALLHYAWIETTQMSYKGEVKSVEQQQCEYGPSGQIVKSQLSDIQEQSKVRGPLRKHVASKEEAELKAYMDSVKVLIGEYVPVQAPRLQLVYQAGNASLNESPASGMVTLAFKNYLLAGDEVMLTFSEATKKLSSVNVNTYYPDPSKVVTLTVTYATLPDGTSYPNRTVLNAEAENVEVQVTNSNYASQAAP